MVLHHGLVTIQLIVLGQLQVLRLPILVLMLLYFTERTNRNFGTSDKPAGSKLPGIVFTPPSTGRYYICALAQASNGTSSNYSAYSMTDGTTEIAQDVQRYPNIVSTPICGIYNAASVAFNNYQDTV